MQHVAELVAKIQKDQIIDEVKAKKTRRWFSTMPFVEKLTH